MTGDPQNLSTPAEPPHDDGPEDPTPADVPRGEADVPDTHAAPADPPED